MLLFRGVTPLRARNVCTDEEEYASDLHSLNEQLSILLQLNEEIWKTHLKDSQVQNSLLLCIASVLHYLGDERRTFLEEWRREYVEILEFELVTRALRLAHRMLEMGAGPLLRIMDISRWITFAGKFVMSHGELLYHTIGRLFEVGILARRQFLQFLSNLHMEQIEKDHDLEVLCFMFAATKANEMDISTEQLVALMTLVFSTEDIAVTARCLSWLARLSSLWSGIDSQSLAKKVVEKSKGLETINFSSDLIHSNNLMTLKPFAEALENSASTKAKLNAIMEAVPKISLNEAQIALSRQEGDVSRVIADKITKSGPDEVTKLLDDKSFVKSHMDGYLYEDEYVDTYDDDVAAKKVESVVDIRSRRDAEGISGIEEQLLRAYIADPMAFGRTAMIRQSKGRKAVCDKLNLSHEQIEGWALMFERNPRRDAVISDYRLLHPL
jgi:hypothetical protein